MSHRVVISGKEWKYDVHNNHVLCFKIWNLMHVVCHEHSVTVIHLQLCGVVVILTRSRQALREAQASFPFFTQLVASSDHRQDLPSPIKHNLCGIQACSVTHSVHAYIFNCVQHNNVASHCHLSSQQYDPCIVMSSHVSGHVDHLGLLRHIRWALTHVLIISSGHLEDSSIQVLASI